MTAPDSSPYGMSLAGRVASLLKEGHSIFHGHREDGGMGLSFEKGCYCHAEVWDGRMPLPSEIGKAGKESATAFADHDEFVRWLASQSDLSLARLNDENEFYHANQTLTRARLEAFVNLHDHVPLISPLRWARLWKAVPAEGDGRGWFDCVFSSYSEEHRHYHTLGHLNECLAELDAVMSLTSQPILLETALWFHDVIYEPEGGFDNEALSADLARDALEEGGAPKAFVRDVRSLILMTKHHVPDQVPDAALMCDIDLAILGRDEKRFLRYEQDIRREYAWVPAADYIRGRSQVLEGFLHRKRIYVTDAFADRYETTARCNLTRSLERLAAGVLL